MNPLKSTCHQVGDWSSEEMVPYQEPIIGLLPTC